MESRGRWGWRKTKNCYKNFPLQKNMSNWILLTKKYQIDVISKFLGPKNPYFNKHHGIRIYLNFYLWPAVRGHLVAFERSNWKTYLNSLTPKTFISIYNKAKGWTWMFDTFLNRGHLVASERSNKKIPNDISFELLDLKILFFNIHHGKMMNLNVWSLFSGQKSFSNLWEVRITIFYYFMFFCLRIKRS